MKRFPFLFFTPLLCRFTTPGVKQTVMVQSDDGAEGDNSDRRNEYTKQKNFDGGGGITAGTRPTERITKVRARSGWLRMFI